MVQAPAAFRAVQRRARRQLGAIADGVHFHRPHQFVRIGGGHALQILADGFEPGQTDLHLFRHLGRLQVVVDHAAQLVFHLGRRQAIDARQRRPDPFALGFHLGFIDLGQFVFGAMARGIFASQLAVHKGAQHVVVRHAGQVARRIQAGYRGAGVLINPHARGRMAAAQADFRDVHLHHLLAVIGAAAFVETSAAGPLVGVQNFFDGADGFLGQMVQLEEHRAVAALQFVVELLHHLTAPVVALDEAFALVIGGKAAEWTGHIGAGRAVVILNQRIDLEAFNARQFSARVVGHAVAIARVGGVFIGAEQVAGRRQAEPAGSTGGQDHRLGADHVEVAGAAVKRHGAGDRAVGCRQQARGDQPVGDLHAGALQAAVQHLLDVVPFRHRQHIRAHVMHLAHGKVAVLVFFKLDAPAVQLLDHRVAVLRVGHHSFLVHDAVIGGGDFLDVLLGRGEAGHHCVVEAVHPHRDGATALDVGFFQQQHAQFWVGLFGLDGGHGTGGAAPDDQHVDSLNVGLHSSLAGVCGTL